MNPSTTPGNRIKELRLAKGISLAQLGKAVGVHESSIFYYEEKSTKYPTPEVLAKIAAALETSPAYLLFGDSETINAGDLDYRARELVSHYSTASESQQAILLGLAREFGKDSGERDESQE